MLNLGRLQVLCEVINRGSFSAAADALSYTQSAVSQAIARLEAETGATLVIRDRRGVRPTAAGTALVTHAESIFTQVEAPWAGASPRTSGRGCAQASSTWRCCSSSPGCSRAASAQARACALSRCWRA